MAYHRWLSSYLHLWKVENYFSKKIKDSICNLGQAKYHWIQGYYTKIRRIKWEFSFQVLMLLSFGLTEYLQPNLYPSAGEQKRFLWEIWEAQEEIPKNT